MLVSSNKRQPARSMVQCRRPATYVGTDGKRVVRAIGPNDNRPNAICRECYEDVIASYPQLAGEWRLAAGEA